MSDLEAPKAASRKSGTPPWFWPVLFAVLGCGMPLAMSFYAMRPAIDAARIDGCMGNLTQLSKAMLLYADDNDDRLPAASRWNDLLSKYVPEKERSIAFHCPATPDRAVGYAMNRALDSRAASKEPNPTTRIVLFDSSDLRPNAAGGPELLPNPQRHVRNVVGMLDGHARGWSATETKF